MRAILTALGACALLGCAEEVAVPPPLDCRVGAYRLEDGTVLDLAQTGGENLRWRLMNGETGAAAPREGAQQTTRGWTDEVGEHTLELFSCDARRIRFDGQAGELVDLNVTDTTLQSEGVTLAGRLVMPAGVEAAPVIVMIGGAERDSSLFYTYRQRLYPAQGVGIFVYDKRGTGASGGEFTEDIHLLAEDAAAAAREARRIGGARISRLGYLGGSEGGSVAPIAQTMEPTDFVVVEYGLAISPMYIDRDLIVDDLRRRGYDAETQAKGARLGEAIATLVSSNYQRGWDEYIALRDEYRSEVWFSDFEGDYARGFVDMPPLLGRIVFPVMDHFTDQGAQWDYDPMPVLESIDAPMLWVVTGSDTTSPQVTTRERLVALQQAGRAITIVDFPYADHGAVEFDGPNDGTRQPLRYAAGFHDAALAFARPPPADVADAQ